MSKIIPCLWFDDQAEEAARFYVSSFCDCGQEAALGKVLHYTDSGPRPKGSVLTVAFMLAGQEFVALNGGPHFIFSPAISLCVTCRDQSELDRFWQTLSEGGAEGQCGWLTDKFGVSWQIVPAILTDMLLDLDLVRPERVMQALMQMNKLDIERLKNAFDGTSVTTEH